jgi:hypothetical protein
MVVTGVKRIPHRLNKLEQLEAPAFNDHLLTIPADDGGAGKGLTGDLRNSDL